MTDKTLDGCEPHPSRLGVRDSAEQAMSTDEGCARGSPGLAAQGAHSAARLAKLYFGGIDPPEGSAARDEFFARLLPVFDRVWHEAAQDAELDDETLASLLLFRRGSEHAAERVPLSQEPSSQALLFFAVPVLIEMESNVPESQVDVALAWAAQAAPDAISPVSIAAPSRASMAAFFRYQDLTAVPLTAVHEALLEAAPTGSCALALRRMPFRARPAAARCSPIYLRFVVGIALTPSERDIERDGGLRWRRFESVVGAALGARLQVPVRVKAEGRANLFEAAHDGLREYQATRLDRIIKDLHGRRGVSALLDPGNATSLRRVRLALMRGRKSLAACILQMPLDEGPAEMSGRIASWLLSRGVTEVCMRATSAESDGSVFAILAVPV
jgi:hypothetical protein